MVFGFAVEHNELTRDVLPFDRYSRYNRPLEVVAAIDRPELLTLGFRATPRPRVILATRFAYMSRRAQLEQLLAAEPNDPFLRYGLAMCCASDDETDLAQEHFRRLLQDHPDYVAGYFQLAQLLTRLGQEEQAKPLLQSGIAVAVRTGDAHAAREMNEFLATL